MFNLDEPMIDPKEEIIFWIEALLYPQHRFYEWRPTRGARHTLEAVHALTDLLDAIGLDVQRSYNLAEIQALRAAIQEAIK